MLQPDAIAMVKYQLLLDMRPAIEEALAKCQDAMPVGFKILVNRVDIGITILPAADRIDFTVQVLPTTNDELDRTTP